MAALDIYESEGLLTRAAGDIGRYWEDALHSLADLPQVIDVRNYGLMGAVEICAPPHLKGQLGPRALAAAWDKGVMVRGVGDAICMSPPLTIERTHIDKITSVLRDVIPTLIT